MGRRPGADPGVQAPAPHTHLPLRAVLHPVLDLVLGLEKEILQGWRGGPAHAQLVLQVPDAAHVHVRGWVGRDCEQEGRSEETR